MQYFIMQVIMNLMKRSIFRLMYYLHPSQILFHVTSVFLLLI